MMENPELIDWLLAGPPWVQYRTRIDLLGQSSESPGMLSTRRLILEHPKVSGILRDLMDWPGYPIKRHNDANHPIHKLAFLADLGLTAVDPGVDNLVDRVLTHQANNGPFQVVVNVHPRYGGRGEEQLAWMLCDTPIVLYSLIKLGLKDDPRVVKAGNYLMGLSRDNGWPCVSSPEMGKFRGPGRKNDPCPYANLVLLKALALVPGWRDQDVCHRGVEVILNLWQHRKVDRLYLFAMGTHFSRLKAPLIWYDILHVMDVLSQYPWLIHDERFVEMANILKVKTDELGRCTPESVWMAWQGWEFGQKVEPSYWITLLVQRIFERIRSHKLVHHEKNTN